MNKQIYRRKCSFYILFIVWGFILMCFFQLVHIQYFSLRNSENLIERQNLVIRAANLSIFYTSTTDSTKSLSSTTTESSATTSHSTTATTITTTATTTTIASTKNLLKPIPKPKPTLKNLKSVKSTYPAVKQHDIPSKNKNSTQSEKKDKKQKKKKKKKPPIVKYLKSLQNPSLFNKKINSNNFDFVIRQSDFCTIHPRLYILIVVHTAPDHFENREYIRETWANAKLYDTLKIRTLFFVGIPKDRKVLEKVLLESKDNRDIVMQNYFDSYRNLTYKAMSWLQWTTENCQDVPYVLKVDDDVYINVFELIKKLNSFDESVKGNINDVMMCKKIKKAQVFRGKNKWKVSKEEYSDDIYPPYCPGFAVIMGRSLVPKLYNASLYTPFYWIDDVYFTGLLTTKLNIGVTDITSWYKSIKAKKDLVHGKALFTYTSIKDKRLREYWDELIQLHQDNVSWNVTSKSRKPLKFILPKSNQSNNAVRREDDSTINIPTSSVNSV